MDLRLLVADVLTFNILTNQLELVNIYEKIIKRKLD